MFKDLDRRRFLASLGSVSLIPLGGLALSGCTGRLALPPENALPPMPVIFVHGNGDTAALWNTIMWRFESNGHPRALLAAIDFPNPLARNVDAVPQANRSGTDEQRDQLAAFVMEVKARTKAPKVALVGSSRGGNSIRHYIKNGGGAEHVSHAILCGTPNHGVMVSTTAMLGNEFNGAHAFLQQLNAGPDEVVPGPAWSTILSDTNDKFAQPEGRHIGQPGVPTGVAFDGPALKGANNIVVPKLDHREVAFHPLAFKAMFTALRGVAPRILDIVPEAEPVLNGKVNGMAGGAPTNLPVAGALVEVFEVDPATGERRAKVHERTTGADGLWGPFKASPRASYEFVLTVPGQAITHIYRSAFPRSSDVVHLRAASLSDADKAAAETTSGSVITLSRPRGYFGKGRDIVLLDSREAPGISDGVPTISTSTIRLAAAPPRAVVGLFNNEMIVARSWPARENRVVQIELHY